MRRNTNYADIVVTCQLQDIQSIVHQILTYNGLTVLWHSPVEGRAVKGSKTGNMLFGQIFDYHELVIQIFPQQDDVSVIRIIKKFKGYHIGRRWIEHNWIDAKFIDSVNKVSSYFYQLGLLQNTLWF
jgi:hypothetical protein